MAENSKIMKTGDNYYLWNGGQEAWLKLGGMGQSHLRMIKSPCAFPYTKLPLSLQKMGDLFSLEDKKGLRTGGGGRCGGAGEVSHNWRCGSQTKKARLRKCNLLILRSFCPGHFHNASSQMFTIQGKG